MTEDQAEILTLEARRAKEEVRHLCLELQGWEADEKEFIERASKLSTITDPLNFVGMAAGWKKERDMFRRRLGEQHRRNNALKSQITWLGEELRTLGYTGSIPTFDLKRVK